MEGAATSQRTAAVPAKAPGTLRLSLSDGRERVRGVVLQHRHLFIVLGLACGVECLGWTILYVPCSLASGRTDRNRVQSGHTLHVRASTEDLFS